MSLVRKEAAHTYTVDGNGQTYQFTVAMDSQGLVSVRDIQGPHGLIQDSYTSIPESVSQGIQDAAGVLRLEVGESEVVSGTVTFTGEVENAVTIGSGTLNNVSYRVVFSTVDGIAFRVKDGTQTTTGFTAITSAAYGSVNDPKDVSYSVLVATSNRSSQGGSVVFESSDAGVKSINFPAILDTDTYRVLLSPNGLFPAWVSRKSKSGLEITIGITLGAGQNVTVGYDILI